MSFIKLPQTWPISFQYTSIVPNWTELAQYLFNELRELNFMSFMSQLFLCYFSLLQFRFSIKMEEHTQISRVIGWMMKGILIWKQCGEEIVDKRIVTLWKKYVFALCLNGIYVRMTLTGITIYVLKNHWHFIKFCLFYVCTDMLDLPFWIEFTGGCKMLKWWFIANHWQTVISLWDVVGGWSNNCYCRLGFLEFFNLLFDF